MLKRTRENGFLKGAFILVNVLLLFPRKKIDDGSRQEEMPDEKNNDENPTEMTTVKWRVKKI